MNDKRLIEDYLPIQAISKEASREKSVRKGHISTLHLWWARRPLVACRAAVYGALVPADQFRPKNGPQEKRASLGRANAAKFVSALCKYPGSPNVIAEAQRHILDAHAARLTEEMGKPVTVADILEGRAPRPKVLDMFAGGGAIPLEALRLGCEAYALDLNPVAHIIELCTLVYPQKYGKPDPTARGMTGPKNDKGDTTWGGLAEEVHYWGNWVIEKAKAEIADLYPLVPDVDHKKGCPRTDGELWKDREVPPGYLVPVAYIWTRTVRCKNPSCQAVVPLARHTWLRRKTGSYVALRMVTPAGAKRVRFEVAQARSRQDVGFNPETGAKAGNATCPFCGTVADSDYVKSEGAQKRLGRQLMAVACVRPGKRGKVYATHGGACPDDAMTQERIARLCERSGLTAPNETIITDAKNCNWIRLYGFSTFRELFTPRQLLYLLTLAEAARGLRTELAREGTAEGRAKAIRSYIGLLVDRQADYNSSVCIWEPGGEFIKSTFGQKGIPLTLDFVELGPFGGASGSPDGALAWIVSVLRAESFEADTGHVVRGSATALPLDDGVLDAIVTDPPYYDNVAYADIADFFYVWLKRTIGDLYPDHFASESTPKKREAVADATRHDGNRDKATRAYEATMRDAFAQAARTLKRDGQMTVVYAHKTTLGWATLVDALRKAGFTVTEAWPLVTERPGRVRAIDSAALASSIFLVARKRDGEGKGRYEKDVRPELDEIVRERVGALWGMGVSGADLVIACVGAGLRAFTRFTSVEYANGEPVPAERFLAEVETVVLESILARLSKEVSGRSGRYDLAGVDPSTRFYVLWRYTYRAPVLDAGEVIVFANGTHVELDGPGGLSSGPRPLLEKKKGKYHLRDYTERGEDKKLGMPVEGQAAPLVDALHRTLWLMERRPAQLEGFLREAQPNLEQMRLVVQALAGPALTGGELIDVSPTGELAALKTLAANWRSVVGGVDTVFFDNGKRGS